MTGVVASTAEEGIQLYTSKFNKIRTAEIQAQIVAKASLQDKQIVQRAKNLCTLDLEEAADSSEKGWFSMDVIELKFELTGQTG